MTEIVLTPEDVEAIAYQLEMLRKNLHLQWHKDEDNRVCTYGCCGQSRPLAERMRQLLPPPLLCPRCEHADGLHAGGGCNHGDCDCEFGAAALPQLREMLARPIGAEIAIDADEDVWEPDGPDSWRHGSMLRRHHQLISQFGPIRWGMFVPSPPRGQS